MLSETSKHSEQIISCLLIESVQIKKNVRIRYDEAVGEQPTIIGIGCGPVGLEAVVQSAGFCNVCLAPGWLSLSHLLESGH